MGEYCRIRVKEKTKGPPLYFRPVLFIEAWGGLGTSAARKGVSEAPASVFKRTFSPRRAIRLRGGGTQAHINPLLSGCNHHRDAHYALSSIYSIKSPTQQFLRAFWAKDKQSDEGEGGKWPT
jgi:hypothetical protein